MRRILYILPYLTRSNQHTRLGLDAREIFFEKELGLKFAGTFFGWGVGGAHNMHVFARLLDQATISY